MSNVPEAQTLLFPLCLGTNGKEVIALQSLLNQLRQGPSLITDGRFGKRTLSAVLAFQRRKGLKADGVVGPSTAKALGWTYQPAVARPYVVRYDIPPLPPMTPPLAVVVKAIRVGMDAFKEMIADTFRKAFANTTFRAVEDGHDKQFHQVVLRLQDLEFHYDKLMSSLTSLESQSASEVETGVAQLRDAFARFVAEMHSSCRALEFYSGDVRACHQALDRLPYQQIVAIIERLLSGEQTAVVAIAQIQLALDNAIRIWAMSV